MSHVEKYGKVVCFRWLKVGGARGGHIPCLVFICPTRTVGKFKYYIKRNKFFLFFFDFSKVFLYLCNTNNLKRIIMKIKLSSKQFARRISYSLTIFLDGSMLSYFFCDLNSICYLRRIKKLEIVLSDIFSDFSVHHSIDVSSCLSDVEDICNTFNIKVID